MKLGPLTIFSREVISEGGSPYLVRYRIFDSPWFGIYLHHILRSDQDRHLHTHPWWFVSVLLWGRYGEVHRQHLRTSDGQVRGATVFEERRAPSIAFRRAEHAHRLVLEKPCWTMVIRGRRRREWGFLTERGWVNHAEYLARENEA